MAGGPRNAGGPGFVAGFSSECDRCGRDILPGQRIIKRRHKYIHVGCASGQDDE